MHPAQRLALLVLAHAVQLETGVAAQQHATAIVRGRAGLGEERPELDEPGVDEQRARRGQRDDRALQRERIGQLRANVLERVAPARHMLEDVPHAEAASAAPEQMPLLTERPHTFFQRHRGRQHLPRRTKLDDDRNVVTFDVLTITGTALHVEAPVGEANPGPRHEDDE